METGRIAAGKYQMIQKIGAGGMSDVYLVKDMTLQRTWAMKTVVRGTTQMEKWKEQQALAEAMLMKRFDHPGFPRIVDLFQEDGITCIVMDYIEGETLERFVMREGPQDEAAVIVWARQLCDMLLYLHTLNPPVIYRDLKPSNIICRSSGRLCLIDFGIAAVGPDESSITSGVCGTTEKDIISEGCKADGYAQEAEAAHEKEAFITGQAVQRRERTGTPGFAAPEQLRDGICSVRTDIYALGMTLYYLLTGLDPRSEEFQKQNGRQLSYSGAYASVSKGMQEIIRKCTERSPSQRYRNCSELMQELLHPVRPAVLLRRKKMRQRILAVTVVAAVLLIAAGAIFQRGVREFTEEETYAARLAPDSSQPPETKERSYLEAIELQPERSEGFIRLLELYETEMDFGARESRQLLLQFQKNRQTLLSDREEAEEILCRIGKLYFFRFQGGDGSARERILRAEPFFEEWHQTSGGSEGTDAACLWEICRFYKSYAAVSAGVQDPEKEELNRMLSAVRQLLSMLEHYSGSDQAAVRLTALREVSGFLNSWRYAFCEAGTEEETMQALILRIAEMADSVETLRADLLQEKEKLAEDCMIFAENIKNAWAKKNSDTSSGLIQGE